jgi:hypothetical protein
LEGFCHCAAKAQIFYFGNYAAKRQKIPYFGVQLKKKRDMSRFDYVTIGIVAVCVAALIYLIYMTTNLLRAPSEPEKTEEISPFYDDDAADLDTSYQDADPGQGVDDWDRTSEQDRYDDRMDEPSSPRTEAPTAAAKPATPQEYTQPRASSAGDYMVLAGTFSLAENAQAMVNRLNQLGYTGASIEPFDRGKYSVVLVARFDSFGQASSLEKELKDKGIEAYVKRKR